MLWQYLQVEEEEADAFLVHGSQLNWLVRAYLHTSVAEVDVMPILKKQENC